MKYRIQQEIVQMKIKQVIKEKVLSYIIQEKAWYFPIWRDSYYWEWDCDFLRRYKTLQEAQREMNILISPKLKTKRINI